MYKLKCRIRQSDIVVKKIQRQGQDMTVQLHEENSASRARYHRLQASAVELSVRMHEVFERAPTQWRDQVVEVAVTAIDHD